jgi:hypothetical protein
MDFHEVGFEVVNWIDLDKDRWWALANAIMNFAFHKVRENSWLAEDLLVSQEGLCSIELVS